MFALFYDCKNVRSVLQLLSDNKAMAIYFLSDFDASYLLQYKPRHHSFFSKRKIRAGQNSTEIVEERTFKKHYTTFAYQYVAGLIHIININ